MERQIEVVHGTSTYAGGRLTRVVGGLDAHGDGVDHVVSYVGPFLYLDDGRAIMGTRQPPFGLHPHTGVVVATYIPAGEKWASDSNVPGFEHVPVHAGEVLISIAGRGVVHDERTDSEGEHEIIQCVMRLPASGRSLNASFRTTIPARDERSIRVFDAHTLGEAGVDARLDHLTLAADERDERELPAEHTTGFVFVRSGSLQVGEVRVKAAEIGLLGGEGTRLRITAGADGCELFIGTGAPIDEPWVKLLGHNGFVIEADVETAAARLAAYAASPDDFPR